MAVSVAEAFVQTARRFASRSALINAHDAFGETIITYGRLLSIASKGARKSFKDGQVVVIGIEEGRDLVAVELAAWLAGAAVCPFDVRKDPRASEVLARLNPDFVVVANSAYDCYTLCPPRKN
jgi:acyl-CoA synthetase (AMP-forming)/AMP-acid ligase II